MRAKRDPENIVTPDQLELWTRRFATMVKAGISLVHCLGTLEADPSSGPLADISRQVRLAVEQGQTLSEAMSAFPQTFDQRYRGLVRVGEWGGILDETLSRQVEWMSQGLVTGHAPGQVTRGEVAEWCWEIARLLNAGVPILFALEVAAASMGGPLGQITLELRDQLREGARLARPGMERYQDLFSPLLVELVAVGEETGSLDTLLMAAVPQLEHEAKLEAAGKLAPLPLPALPAVPAAAEWPDPNRRRVNEVLASALQRGAEWVKLEPGEQNRGRASFSTRGKPVGRPLELPDYEKAVRIVKLLANIDPFDRESGQGTVHVRWENRDYRAAVHSYYRPHGNELRVHLQPASQPISVGRPP